MGFDRARVVQIWSPAVPGHQSSGDSTGGGAGSGYRVGAELVLTAAHVVTGHPTHGPADAVLAAGGGGGIKVAVLGSSTWVSAVVVWRNEDADVAVLRALGLPGVPAGSPAPRWGKVTGREPMECMAVGFPWAAVTPHQQREAEHMVGFIPPISGAVTGAQVITVRSSPPLPRTDAGSPWAGMSGAGVFCGRYLVGVIVVDPVRYGTDRLRAAPLAPLLERDAELRTLLGAPAELAPVRMPSRLAITGHESIGLRPAYQPLPAGMDLHGAAVQLLLPEHGVVPFSGRADQLGELQEWCDQDRPVALRVVTGDGGAGKTRLAAELCAVMFAQGWDTGFADPDLPGGDIALEYDRATLVVVDEADRHVDLLAKLFPRLAYRDPAAPPVRLVLVARTTAGWWDQLNRRTKSAAQGYAGRQPPLQLATGGLPLEQRLHQYREAYHRFNQFRSVEDLSQPPTEPLLGSGTETTVAESNGSRAEGEAEAFPAGLELSDPTFANPLLVHMTALLAAFPNLSSGSHPNFPEGHGTSESDPEESRGAEESTREVILRSVLDREKHRWVEDPGYPTDAAGYPDDITADQAVTMATLTVPATEQAAIQLLAALPWLTGSDEAQRRAVARWLHRLYPGPTEQWVGPLRPDLLAEQLLATTEQLDDLTDALLGQLFDAQEKAAIGALLGELVRASRRAPVRQALHHLLDAHLPIIVDHAMADRTGQISAVLDRALRAAPQQEQALKQVRRLPARSIILAPLALTLTQQTVDQLRAQVVTDPQTFTPDLASVLGNLSNSLGQMGRHEEALAAIEEATEIFRGLTAGRPEVFTPGLALALNNLSSSLSVLGRREEALAAIEEATGIYRGLVTAHPEAFTSGLARALTNLSVHLAELGRREEALAAIEEATGIYRGLATAHPEASAPDLARALNNLSNHLAELGRREEALAAIEEATGIYRGLATAHPEAFTSGLALALNNLSLRLAELGRREEALTPAEEATGIYRGLATARPELFASSLARTLTDLSSHLAGLGRREEALAAAEEATRIWSPPVPKHSPPASPGDW